MAKSGRWLFLFAVFLFVIVASSFFASAFVSNSSSYGLTVYAVANGGGNMSSSNFFNRIIAGIISGITSSASYLNSLGFWHTVPANVLPPDNPVVNINSTDGSNLSTSNLNCFANITDPNSGNLLNVSLIWYKNSVSNLRIDYNNSYANNTFFNAVLGYGNLTNYDNWSCGMVLFDGQSYSNWVNSSSLTVSTSISTCNAQIGQPGTYTVANDISCPGWALNISSDNVTLDGNGKTITYNTVLHDSPGITLSGQGASATQSNIAIMNLTISASSANLDSGMYFFNIFNMTIKNSNLISGGQTIAGLSLSKSSIYNNYIKSFHSSGVENYDSYGLLIYNNTIDAASSYSIELGHTSTGILISNNTLTSVWDLSIGYYTLNVDLNLTNQVIKGAIIGGPAMINFENSSSGKIIFYDYIRTPMGRTLMLDNFFGTKANGADIGLGNNSAFINSSIQQLNMSAKIWLYNLPNNFANPVVLRDGLVCTDCYNLTSLNAGNVLFNVTKGGSYAISNGPPNTPAVYINSTDGSNMSTSNLNCFANITDPNSGDLLNVSLIWYKNSVSNLRIDYNNSYANNTFFNAVLGYGNLTKYDNWSCGMRLYNGWTYSNWANSSNLRILNSPPTVVLNSPVDGNTTLARNINFTWTGADADGDPLTYEINITSYKTGNPNGDDDPDVSGIASTKYTSSKLKYLYDYGYYYVWKVRANDGEVYGNWSASRIVNVSSYVASSMPTSLVQFGSIDLLGSNDTTTDSPAPFVIRNDGNALANVSVSATNLWSQAANPSNYYKFKIRNDSGSNIIFDWVHSITSWAQFPTAAVIGIAALNDSDGSDSAKIDVYVSVPPGEPPGGRNSTVTLVSSLGE